MRDVAALSGTSLKTVSRVINDEPGVRDEIAQRVRRAAEQLAYRPNLTASSLRRLDRRTATLGLLLQDLANPFSAAVARAVEDVARTRNVAVLAASLDEDLDRERALIGEFIARQVDGLIIAPVSGDQHFLHTHRDNGLPVVYVDRVPDHLDADAVIIDNETGAETATRHLISHGHRRIGLLTDVPTVPTAALRRAGYRTALAAAGIPYDPTLVNTMTATDSDGHAATLKLLTQPDPPTALFTAQNQLTIGAIRALTEHHLNHRIALIGFDDFPLADLLDPPITVITQNVTHIGTHAAHLLFSRIDGHTTPPQRITIPTQLITRGSGEITPDHPDITRSTA